VSQNRAAVHPGANCAKITAHESPMKGAINRATRFLKVGTRVIGASLIRAKWVNAILV
jgi:hypothetical protein